MSAPAAPFLATWARGLRRVFLHDVAPARPAPDPQPWLLHYVGPAVLVLAVSAGLSLRWASTPAGPQLRYTTAELTRGALREQVIATGTLSATSSVSVGSRVSGRVDSLRAERGQRVQREEVLATLEVGSFVLAVAEAKTAVAAARAALDTAKARERAARMQLERARELNAEGFLTGADYDQIEALVVLTRTETAASRANVDRARAALDRASLDLAATSIVSPVDGTVILREVDLGQWVSPAAVPAMFTIAGDLTHLELDAFVRERDIGKVREGMPVALTVAAHAHRTFTGRVRLIGDVPRMRLDQVTYDAVIAVENADRALKPGMTASVAIIQAERLAVLRVPNTALQFAPGPDVLELMKSRPPVVLRSNEKTLWVLRDGSPVPLPVRVGITDGTWTELPDDVTRPGDRAIVSAVLVKH